MTSLNSLLIMYIITFAWQINLTHCQTYCPCTSDTDCNTNAFCAKENTKKCKCYEGFEMIPKEDNYKCLETSDDGSFCDEDMDCRYVVGADTECINKKCQCMNDFILGDDGQCILKNYLGETCISDDSCQWIESAQCSPLTKTCSCPSNMKSSADRLRCLKSSKIGEICASDEECASDGIKCESVCKCKPDYVLSRNGYECLKTVKNDEDLCFEDAQCSSFLEASECHKNQCVCKSGMHRHENKCIKSAVLGSQCEKDEECTFDADMKDIVICEEEKCVCKHGINKDTSSCNIRENSSNVNFLSFTMVWICVTISTRIV